MSDYVFDTSVLFVELTPKVVTVDDENAGSDGF